MEVVLVMFKEGGTAKRFPLESGKTVIGRGENCSLRIPLAEISRKHAALIVSDDGVTIRDLGSANGSYVNNRRVSEQELQAGDHIVVGPVVFTLEIDGEPADIKPVHTRLEAKPEADEVEATAAMVSGDPTDVIFQDEDDDDDPISALEALAATDDTAAIDLDDSAFDDED